MLRSEYITTARAKGLPRWLILSRHALKNALISVVTFVGIQFGRLLGGAIVIEAVFAWPGIGNLAVQSLQSRDYPMVQGVVLVVSIMFIFSNLIVDLFYSVLDPRIRYD